jgi:hypothetical protein
MLFFASSAFAEGRFSPQIPYIHQHWRCILPFIALQNLGWLTSAETVARAGHLALQSLQVRRSKLHKYWVLCPVFSAISTQSIFKTSHNSIPKYALARFSSLRLFLEARIM